MDWPRADWPRTDFEPRSAGARMRPLDGEGGKGFFLEGDRSESCKSRGGPMSESMREALRLWLGSDDRAEEEDISVGASEARDGAADAAADAA